MKKNPGFPERGPEPRMERSAEAKEMHFEDARVEALTKQLLRDITLDVGNFGLELHEAGVSTEVMVRATKPRDIVLSFIRELHSVLKVDDAEDRK